MKQNPLIEEFEHQQEALKRVKEKIRTNFKNCSVVFIDMVNSTQFKFANRNEPEVWITKLFKFTEIVSAYVKQYNGTIIKYIGDEIMAVFRGENLINDTINFLSNLDVLKAQLSSSAESEMDIKVSVDYGKVFYFKYDDNLEEDPQGTPVDRCARVGKLCEPGTVLTSTDFMFECRQQLRWLPLGKVYFKGLGDTEIFQLNSSTINLNKSDGNLHQLQAAGRVCDLLSMVNAKEHAPSAFQQWAYERRCLVHDYTILEKYKIAIDVYLDRLPIDILLFARDKESKKFLIEEMCKSPVFLDQPFETNYVVKGYGLVYASFSTFQEIPAISLKLIELLSKMETYIKSITPKIT